MALSGIRANPSVGTTGYEGGINSAILRYEGATDEDPTTSETTSINPLNEFDLHVRKLVRKSIY